MRDGARDFEPPTSTPRPGCRVRSPSPWPATPRSRRNTARTHSRISPQRPAKSGSGPRGCGRAKRRWSSHSETTRPSSIETDSQSQPMPVVEYAKSLDYDRRRLRSPAYWLPRSECATSSEPGRRPTGAISRASATSRRVIAWSIDDPTIRRPNRFSTTATRRGAPRFSRRSLRLGGEERRGCC